MIHGYILGNIEDTRLWYFEIYVIIIIFHFEKTIRTKGKLQSL